MIAIILASGIGNRLRPLTNRVPKSLLEVGAKPIIDYQVESLARHGIEEILVTTGHLGERIEGHLRGAGSVKTRFVYNPRYADTNYIYSLWLAGQSIDDDVMLVHGDLICDDEVIKALLESDGNRVPVNRTVPAPEKDFKALVEGGRVTRIGVDVSGPNAFFCAPAYTFSAIDFRRWMERIGDFVDAGRLSCYAEDALNELLAGGLLLRPLFFESFCMEIDTADDLEMARAWAECRGKQGTG
jgi:choline kinase